MSEEMLIGLVRQYVFLYDTSHPRYMDSTKKEAAWNEISQILNQPASACKHKWQSLRDAYRRALNKRKLRLAEAPTARIKKWKFEDEISYLHKYLRERKKGSRNANDGQTECDDETVSNSDLEGSFEFYKNENEDIELTENNEQYTVAVDPADFAHSPSHIIHSIQKHPASYVTTNCLEDVPKGYKEHEVAHDQMDLFFLSLSNTVKSFTPYLQAVAKNKIFNLVSELEIQQLTPGNSNTAPQTGTIPQTANWLTTTQIQQNSSNVDVKSENSTNE